MDRGWYKKFEQGLTVNLVQSWGRKGGGGVKKHPIFKQILVTVPTFPYDLVPLVEGGGTVS